MVELGSDVPLTKDILAKKKQFTFGFYEFLKNNAISIVHFDKNVSNSSAVIFTVPARQTLYIEYLSILSLGNGNDSQTSIDVNSESFINSFAFNGTSRVDSVTFPFPFKLEEGGEIFVSTTGGVGAQASYVVMGFLISKEITPIT